MGSCVRDWSEAGHMSCRGFISVVKYVIFSTGITGLLELRMVAVISL